LGEKGNLTYLLYGYMLLQISRQKRRLGGSKAQERLEFFVTQQILLDIFCAKG
jgi:hypothetical protein